VSAVSLAATSAAHAVMLRGTDGPDRLMGTASPDAIYGLAGADRLDGRGGNDLLSGGAGRDRVVGGAGDDRIAVQADGASDQALCGAGRDIVNAELADTVADDCEVVSRQLSRDTTVDFRSQHETQVEPDSFAFGQTIVAVFQNGRFVDGGASDIGFATSRDAGRTWRSGSIPRLTFMSTPPGTRDAVSDPAVAYDALHGVWLVVSLGLSQDATELLVSRSRDGLTWMDPVVAAGDPAEDLDKEWIVCDNWRTSPFRGSCYVSYLDVESGEIRTRRSTDGGQTWSEPAGVPGRTSTGVANGVQPVVGADGALVVPFAVFAAFSSFADPNSNAMVAVRSTDGGASFGPRARISRLDTEDVRGIRAAPLPSAEVDAGGTIYLAWSDCRFREACLANDILISRSSDGISWSAPARVPVGPASEDVQYFLPGLAVDPATSGPRARLALAYHSLRQDCGFARCPGVDVHLVTSNDGGTTWSRPQRLNAESMKMSWIADSGLGRMLGDYISTSFVAGRPIPVYSLASEPSEGEFRQAIFAATKVTP
jgi:hypothetical protein